MTASGGVRALVLAPRQDGTIASDSHCRYRKIRSYKYQLLEPYRHATELEPEAPLATRDEFVGLGPNGLLSLRRGYAWDGPSGPTLDTKNFMRASLVHDALYQLMREGLLDSSQRLYADRLLRTLCRQDGMSRFRAWYVYRGVRAFGGRRARPPGHLDPILRAP